MAINLGSILPLAGMAAGAFIPGLSPAVGMMLGGAAGGYLGNAVSPQPTQQGIFGNGMGGGISADALGGARSGSSGAPENPFDAWGEKTPQFAPDPKQEAAAKANSLQQGLMQIAAMDDKKRQQQMQNAELGVAMNPYRQAPAPALMQANPGQFGGGGNAFAYSR